MRGPSTLLVLAGLTAVAHAEQLLPDDVPLECGTICGPMVELTDICEIGLNNALSRVKRRKVSSGEKAKRQFRIATPPGLIAQVPSSSVRNTFATGPVQSVSRLNLRPTATPNRIVPVLVPVSPTVLAPISTVVEPIATTSGLGPVATTTIVLQLTTRTDATTTHTAIAQASLIPGVQMGVATGVDDGAGAADPWPEQKAKEDEEYLERDCVCLNTSFDVAKVAPLCLSCMQQTGDIAVAMTFIVGQCNFTETVYSPNLDSAADNIRVVASKPVFSSAAGSNAGINSSASRRTGVEMGTAVAVGFCVIMAFIL